MDENENDWDEFIDGALFATNTNVSSTTNFSSFIMFGRQTRLPFDVEKYVQQAERRMLQYIDKMATTRNVMVSQGRTQHNHSSGETKQGNNERGRQAYKSFEKGDVELRPNMLQKRQSKVTKSKISGWGLTQ